MFAVITLSYFSVAIYYFTNKDNKNTNTFLVEKRRQQHRIAIIIPFIGETPGDMPSYIGLFCMAAEGSLDIVDFLIFHTGILNSTSSSVVPCPKNVIFHSLGGVEEMAKTLSDVVDQNQGDEDLSTTASKKKAIKFLTQYIQKYPYALVEFKPVLGHVFRQYLEGYTHWGYSDLDIIFGDLNRWITLDELNDYDIVTYGFGDQNRI